jgi:hypothetical protein
MDPGIGPPAGNNYGNFRAAPFRRTLNSRSPSGIITRLFRAVNMSVKEGIGG